MDIKDFIKNNIAGPAIILLSPLIDDTLDAAADEAASAAVARVQATDNNLDDMALLKAARFFKRLAAALESGMANPPADPVG